MRARTARPGSLGWLGRLALILALSLWALVALPCQAAPSLAEALAERLEREPAAAVYAWLAARPPAPGEAADHHRWLAQLAFRLGDYAAAAAHYEQAVTRRPWDLGSRLELTLAYQRQGNRAAARASLDALRHYHRRYAGDAPLPAAAAEQVARLDAALAAWSGDALAGASGRLGLTLGHDSNANLGASRADITLNLWGEVPWPTELAPESLATPSPYSELEGQLNLPLAGLLAPVWADWHLEGEARLRRYHALDRLHRRDLRLGLRWQPPGLRHQLGLDLMRQRLAGETEQWRLAGDYRRMLGARWLLSAGWQSQREAARRTSHTLQLGAWYQWRGLLLWGQASQQFRPDRPGGDTRRLQLGVQGPAWPLGAARLRLFGHSEWRRDSAPYSRAFFGDVARRETTLQAGLLAELPLGADWQLSLRLSAERTRANLALFDSRRAQAEARLSWRW